MENCLFLKDVNVLQMYLLFVGNITLCLIFQWMGKQQVLDKALEEQRGNMSEKWEM